MLSCAACEAILLSEQLQPKHNPKLKEIEEFEIIQKQEADIASSHINKAIIAILIVIGLGLINPLGGIIVFPEIVRQAYLSVKHLKYSIQASKKIAKL